jgi:O-antigen/teichoic acid export membrane protein
MGISRLSGGLAWLGRVAAAVVDQGLVAGAGFMVNVLLARWLAPADYGAYTVAFSVFLFVSGFHNALVLEPMCVFGPSSYKSDLRAYLGKLVRLHFAICLLLASLLGLGVAVSRHWIGSATFSDSALWGSCLGIPCVLFFWLWRQAAYLELRPELAVRGAAVYTLVTFVLMLAFHRLGWLSPFGAFALQATAALAASVLLIVLIWPHLSSRALPSPSPSILRRHWEYGRWAVVTAFVYWFSGGVSYVIAGLLLGMRDVAALRALQTFVLPFPQFITAVSRLLVPWASARFADRDAAATQRAIGRITLLFASAAFLSLASVWLFGKPLIDLMYKGRYIEFSYLLPLLAVPVLFTAAAQGPAVALQAMRLPSEVSLAYAAAAAVNILAGVTLTHYWGLVGNVLGMSSASLAFLVVIWYRYNARLSWMLQRESRQPEFGSRAVHAES